ncbi:hypothetical protein F4808DRAFT_355323 [Astrocystis sublimbata]|nr:hypothetical protein F4808DRAFT_355323 [Astrocystis sublimbata]
MSSETSSHVNGVNGVNGNDHSASRWLPTKEEIVQATAHEIELSHDRLYGQSVRGIRLDAPSASAPPVWVKFTSSPEFLFTEMKTQQYVHSEWVKADQDVKARLLVPEVFDYIEADIDDDTYGFIVMEYLPGKSIRELVVPFRLADVPESDERITSLKDRVIEAVCFLLSLAPPPETAPGPVGGGRMKSHAFGRDDPEAHCKFDSVEDLQMYFNDEIEKEEQDFPLSDFLSEDLRLCCCDLGLHNFMLQDENNPQQSKLIIIDFEMTNWLPQSFMVWECWNTRDAHISTGITNGGRLEIHEDTIHAIDCLRNRRDRIEHEYWVRVSNLLP